MRTLKKTLALVLCLAMMVGLCAFGASAKDFTDAEEIEYAEEVALLTGIGVIDGIPVGDEFKFDPTGILTREQAAKIITTMLGYGEIAPKAAPFTDVASDRWSAGYIATCAGLGIVAGRGDGTFDPTGKLTAEAWQKMLLCALGYDAEAEGLVGASWEVGVAKLVKKTELSDGITLSPIAEVTREQACKLAYNALTIPEVEYNGGTHVSTGDGTVVDINNPANVIANSYIAKNFGLAVANTAAGFAKDSFAGTDATSILGAGGVRTFGTDSVFLGVITKNSANASTKTTTLDAGGANGVFAVDTGKDLLGHYVKIYQSTKKNADGTYDVFDIQDLSTTAHVYGAANTKAKFVKAFGSTLIDGANPVYSFPTGPAAVVAGAGSGIVNNAGTDTWNTDTFTTYILDPTGAVKAKIRDDYAVMKLSVVTKIDTAEGNETISLAGYGMLSNGKLDSATKKPVDIVTEYDGIAVGDYVVVTQMGDDVASSVYTLTKCETVTGTITTVGTSAANQNDLTIDGVTYSQTTFGQIAGNVIAPVGYDGGTGNIELTAAAIKANTYTLYLDGNGDYFGCVLTEGASVASAAMYVVDVYDKNEDTTYGPVTKTYAQVLDADGNMQNICIGVGAGAAYNNGTGINAAGAAAYANTFMTFKTDTTAGSQSGRLGFQKAEPVAAPLFVDGITAKDFTATATKIAMDGGTGYLNAETKYVFFTGNLQTLLVNAAVTGGITMNGVTAQALYTLDANGNKVIKTVVSNAAYANASVDPAALLYVASATATGTTAKGSTYTAYKCDTGEKITITCTGAGAPVGIGFYNFAEKDGIYTLTGAAGTSIKENELYVRNYNSSIIADDTDPATDPYDITADTTSAIFVDTRSAAAIGTEGALTSLDAFATAKTLFPAKKIVVDMLLAKQGTVATIIFVRSFA